MHNSLLLFLSNRTYGLRQDAKKVLNIPSNIRCEETAIYSSNVCKDFTLDIVDSKWLLSGFSNGDIKLVNTQTFGDKVIKSFEFKDFKRKQASVKCVQWYPVDIGLFFSASVDKRVEIWDTNHQTCVDDVKLPHSINWISASECAINRNLIAAACEKNKVYFIDLVSGANTHVFTHPKRKCPINCVEWHKKVPYVIATADHLGGVVFWDIRQDKRPLYELDGNYYGVINSLDTAASPLAHTSSIKSLDFSPDGLTLCTIDVEGFVRIWDLLYPHQRGIAQSVTRLGTPLGIWDESLNMASASRPMGGIVNHSRIAWTNNGVDTRVWIPSILELISIEIKTGSKNSYMSNHFDKITSVVWNDGQHEMYTSSLDSNVLRWKSDIFSSSQRI